MCEELGIPVGINVGIPGPRVRSNVQHPERLEDVMIDFPDLVVIGAHMGHPYEELLMNYMRKWPNLYLSCTAYAPRYFDPALVHVHEHEGVPGPGDLGERRAVVPDAPLARRGAGAADRRGGDGALPRRHRPPAARPHRAGDRQGDAGRRPAHALGSTLCPVLPSLAGRPLRSRRRASTAVWAAGPRCGRGTVGTSATSLSLRTDIVPPQRCLAGRDRATFVVGALSGILRAGYRAKKSTSSAATASAWVKMPRWLESGISA